MCRVLLYMHVSKHMHARVCLRTAHVSTWMCLDCVYVGVGMCNSVLV